LPGTQYSEDRFVPAHKPGILQRIRLKLFRIVGLSVYDEIERSGLVLDVNTKAGDLLIFDLRIDHRSTFAKRAPAEAKYAVFNTFGTVDGTCRQYQDYLKTRDEPYYRFLRGHTLPSVLRHIADKYGITVYY
jgi:hypothetical protein